MSAPKPKGPLEGLKVADFAWVGVGPLISRYLANYGATVVKIESSKRIDVLRHTPPFKNDEAGLNRTGLFNGFNVSKLSVTLNLAHPKGKELAKRFIMWADVMTISFTPSATERLGFDYKNIRQLKPDIIYISTSQQGYTGPHRDHPGFGLQLTFLSGAGDLTGWTDREPVGPYGAWTDYVSHRQAIVPLLAAIDRRRRTGQGACIEQSQLEATAFLQAPLYLDLVANGHMTTRAGNTSPCGAPHGVYPCKGKDRWCAIAVFHEPEWQALCQVMGKSEMAADKRFATLEMRKKNESELDTTVAGWTSQNEAGQVMHRLQAAGVAAGLVEDARDLFNDPQLNFRNHFVRLEHPEMGTYHGEQHSFRLSKSPGGPQSAAPCLGEHTEYVYKEILGLSDEEFVEMLNQGVFD